MEVSIMRAHHINWAVFLAAASFVLLVSSEQTTVAKETVVVVPNNLKDVEGPSSVATGEPAGPFRFQQIFAASQFASLAEHQRLLTQFAWRPDRDNVTRPMTVTLDDVEIRFSTTSRDPEHLSETYEDNVWSDETIVYVGPLTLHTENVGPPGGPRQFDYIIDLQTPFPYDPKQGNLLMDFITYSGITSADTALQDFILECSSLTCLVIGSPYSQTASAPWGGIVTQFTFFPCEYSLVGDLNDDCRVDFCDLCLMLDNWLVDCSATPEDPACMPK
jgi:hypothetical protein